MRPDRVTIAAFIGFVLIAGAVSVAIRLGAFELPSFWAATLRYAMAVPIFAALAIALRIPFPRGANLLGALLFSLTFVVSTALLYVGVSGSSASMGAIAFALTPLVTLALAAAIGLERFTQRGVVGALIAAAGVVIVVSDQLGAAVPLPALLALGGAMLFSAVTSVVIKRLPPGHPISANAVGGLFVLPILAALSFFTHESWDLPSRPETWAALGVSRRVRDRAPVPAGPVHHRALDCVGLLLHGSVQALGGCRAGSGHPERTDPPHLRARQGRSSSSASGLARSARRRSPRRRQT